LKNIVIKHYSTSQLIHLENATDQLYVNSNPFPENNRVNATVFGWNVILSCIKYQEDH